MPTDQQFGLGRMWEAYTQKMPWVYRVVRSKEEAEKWLKKKDVPDNLIK